MPLIGRKHGYVFVTNRDAGRSTMTLDGVVCSYRRRSVYITVLALACLAVGMPLGLFASVASFLAARLDGFGVLHALPVPSRCFLRCWVSGVLFSCSFFTRRTCFRLGLAGVTTVGDVDE